MGGGGGGQEQLCMTGKGRWVTDMREKAMLAQIRFCRYKRYARWFYDKPDKHDIEMPGMRGLKDEF